ncbi:hypothetical protein RE476_03335 [Methanolobus mangrovi]|uniref:Uncharacterized protein n=1 Tax=Methanolobus mangrovi TaxID=3072977 RepID=A0AA51UGT5_9EURY|nr:hypothetical protein [Methanolobus mangrovi]WMW22870.1 hypothetical protein RE476_03335 [Methanolobus mangrovi]
MSELNMQTELDLENLLPLSETLLETDENKLYMELGRRYEANITNVTESSKYRPLVHEKDKSGFEDKLKKLGIWIFKRLEIGIHNVLCSSEDNEPRNMLAEAFKLGKKNAAEVLVIVLVKYFAIASNIAIVLAVIILIIFRPVYRDFCNAWKEKLPATI